jgi:hypothetical protein
MARSTGEERFKSDSKRQFAVLLFALGMWATFQSLANVSSIANSGLPLAGLISGSIAIAPSAVPSASQFVPIGEFVQGGDLWHYSAIDTLPLIKWLEGDPNEAFFHHDHLLSQRDCEELKLFIDDNEGKSATSCRHCHLCSDDIAVNTKYETKLKITASELKSLIGFEAVKSLVDFYSEHTGGAPVNSIILRRLRANSQHVPYHLDVHNYILQVPLNDVYTGGKLVLLNENGTFYPSREVGSATLMDASRLVHGVSKLTSGVRYGMYLLNDPTLPQRCILTQELNEAVLMAGNETESVLCDQDLTLARSVVGFEYHNIFS